MPCKSIYGKDKKKEIVLRSKDNLTLDLDKKDLKPTNKLTKKYKKNNTRKKTKKTLSKIGKGFEKTRKKRAKRYAKSIFGKL